MIEGPWRAPSSPPEMPVPINRMPFSLQTLRHVVSVSVKMAIAAIDDDIALFEEGQASSMSSSTGCAGLDHQHHFARLLEQP